MAPFHSAFLSAPYYPEPMNWLRTTFVGLVALSVVLGGVTAVEFGDRLGDIDTTTDVAGEIEVSVVDAVVEEDRFLVTVRVRNPTDSTLVLQNAGLRVHNDSVERIAAGPGRRIDDGPSRVGSRDSVEATFELSLSATERRRLESVVGRDARLSMNVGMRYRSTEFDVEAADLPLSGEREGGDG